MRISELLKTSPDSDVLRIVGEREFDRFARTTSISEGNVCVFVASEQYIKTIPSNASMIITTESIADRISDENYGICISNNPKATYFRAFVSAISDNKKNQFPTIFGKNTRIGKLSVISDVNVKIGNNVIIEDFVTIYENVTIGDNCIIRSGVRLGVQDYNYFNDNGSLTHLPHYGELIIQDNVEIGFNTVVGISLYPSDTTVIGSGSKIANECGIGHDCKIGNNVMIYAGTLLAGFVEIGENTHITLNSTIKNGLKIGKNVQVNMASVVIRDIPDGHTVFGNPAKRVITPQ